MANNQDHSKATETPGFPVLRGLARLRNPLSAALNAGRDVDSTRVRGQALRDLKSALAREKAAADGD